MLADFTVFMSHASADKPVALRIKQGLEDNHVRVWIDVAEIRVGESIPKKIAEGLTVAGALCLLVSQHALASPWAMREFNAFLHQSISDGRPIVPCRLDDSPMPPLIGDIKYADFSKSFDEGMGALLSSVRIAEEVLHRKEVAKYKGVLEAVLALRPAVPRAAQLHMLHECQIKVGGATTDEENALVSDLQQAFEAADEDFDGFGWDHEGRLRFYGALEDAFDELHSACA